MKNIYIISIACAFTLCSCIGHKVRGSGVIKTETRDLPAFETVTFDGSFNVEIECQTQQALTVEADENLLPLIKTEVKNNSLHVYTEKHLWPSKRIQVAISIPNLSGLTINGTAKGDIRNVNNSSLSVEIGGAARLHLSGKTVRVKINTAGASKIDATSLISENAEVRIAGVGDIHVCATNSIDATIDGAGTIKYSGGPKNVDERIHGLGTIERE